MNTEQPGLSDDVMEKVMAEVMSRMVGPGLESPYTAGKQDRPPWPPVELVGTGPGDTIGLVLANVDASLGKHLGKDTLFCSLGIIGSRIGSHPQIMAADEALKATNAQLVLAQFPRDMKGGAGDGCLLILGAQNITEVRRAVKFCLHDLQRTYGEFYKNCAGHIQLQFSSHVGKACETVYGAHANQAFGVIVGAPAPIGIFMADTAMKSANVEISDFVLPDRASYANESTLLISGDAGAVCRAVLAAKEAGLALLNMMSKQPVRAMGEPYIGV